jgi:hypothetical protein
MSITEEYRRHLIRTSLEMMGDKYTGPEAEQILAAIAYQESNFKYRKQINGPARGFWQFERGGGVVGVMKHAASKKLAARLCEKHLVEFESNAIYKELAENDTLACQFARLLLYTDPRALPTEQDESWDYYIRNWRPGKPHPHRWPECWNRAKTLFTS